MPFPVDEKYIIETEKELKVKFPPQFKRKMMILNGSDLIKNDFGAELYPFFDKSDKKRISRTCNHIGLETKNLKEWADFPDNAIAIASDGFGNQLVLIHNGDGVLLDEIYFWEHETNKLEKIANSINEFN